MMTKKFLSVEDARTYLGLSRSAIYKLSHSKTLPKFCPNGKKIYFLKEDIDAWMLNHKILSDHSSVPFWYNHQGKYYGEVKITGQPVRLGVIQLPNEENQGGDCHLDLFEERFDDIGNNIYPDDDPNWQKAFIEKQIVVTRLGLNNNLNLYTNNEIKYGHLEMYFKPF